MIGYRLTKYDPNKRDRDGIYLSNDWTSISDIGHVFNGVTLTTKDYLRVENAYVEAAKALMLAASIRSMRVKDLEARAIRTHAAVVIDDDVIEKCRQVCDNKIVSAGELELVVRGCLREYIWCRLVGAGGSYIHFGFDYYMYAGLPSQTALPALPQEIFLERMDSPYSEED